MPINKKTSAEYAQSMIEEGERLNNAIEDLRFGPLADTCIRPQAAVMEDINTDLRDVDSKLTLADPTVFEGDNFADLEGIAYNSGIQTSLGSPSYGTFYAVSVTGPSATQDIVIPRGYPIPALGGDGITVTFLADSEVRVALTEAPAYFDPSSGTYRIPVAATSIQRGETANVAANSVGTNLRTLSLISSIELTQATTGGSDPNTVEDLIQLILLADQGEDARLGTGLKASILSRFPQSRTVAFAGPGEELLSRPEECPLDVFVQGVSAQTRRDVVEYTGVGQLIELPFAPVTEIISVRSLSTAVAYTQDDDFELVTDISGLSGSTRAVDGIRFLGDAGSTPTLGTADTVLTVEYSYNGLIHDMQAEFESEDLDDRSRSILFRAGEAKPIVLTYEVRLYSGFDEVTVLQNINTVLIDAINNLGMGEPVERSDLNDLVRNLSSVDNFRITELYFEDDVAAVNDLELAKNEYATLTQTNLSGSRF